MAAAAAAADEERARVAAAAAAADEERARVAATAAAAADERARCAIAAYLAKMRTRTAASAAAGYECCRLFQSVRVVDEENGTARWIPSPALTTWIEYAKPDLDRDLYRRCCRWCREHSRGLRPRALGSV